MKGLLLAFSAIVGGAGIGAVGTAAYQVFTGDVVVGEMAEAEVSLEGMESGAEASVIEVAPEPTGLEPESEAETSIDEPNVEASLSDGTETLEALEPGPTETPSTAAVIMVPPAAPALDADSLARVAVNHQRLGRIFAAMKPAEAASVLAQLADSELEGILMAMPERNAAPILAKMDPERAAALSRLVLRGNE